ncbi:MAG: hypothetical protein KAS19_12910, partial [Anaerolineales bacterium]|nr:hypothetical protein [Anaerolineales bacterium]
CTECERCMAACTLVKLGKIQPGQARIDIVKSWPGLPEDVKGYIGGMGYGTRILIDEVSPGIDPLSPENKLIFSVGPLTGTNAPMAPQTCVVTKSPLTGTILNCYAGGFLGAEIKFSGIDGIILEGRSADWTIILIEDGRVSFHSAEKVTGKGTRVTENYMKELFGEDVRTLSIGRRGKSRCRWPRYFLRLAPLAEEVQVRF